MSDDDDTTRLVSRRIDDLTRRSTPGPSSTGDVAEARLFALAQFMGDVYAGALLTEQAAWARETGRANARRWSPDSTRSGTSPTADRFAASTPSQDESIERFDELCDGALNTLVESVVVARILARSVQ